ncbi:MAG: stalk domain-containing protein [Caldiserica bacterium]|nr:stalk domain-containing protein [Caldisericota bacterium]
MNRRRGIALVVLLGIVMSSAWAPSVVPADAASVKTIVLRVGDPIMQVDAVRTFIDSTGAVPVIIQGRTMLPVRAIVEALGGTVSWDAARRAVGVVFGARNLELIIAKSFAVVNGIPVAIDPANALVVPVIVKGRTMLPVRFVAEELGATVGWAPATQVVTLDFGGTPVPPPAAPVLTAPDDASSSTDETPSFSWNAVSGAATYRVVIRKGTDVVLDKSGLTALSFTVPAGLLIVGTYSWTVMATGPGGTSAPQAKPFTFTVKDVVVQPLAQTVEMRVKYSGWDPSTIHIKAGAQITWNIWGDEVTSCTNRIVVPSLRISQALTSGKNIITFTAPATAGTVPFACWMNMVRGQFIVDP